MRSEILAISILLAVITVNAPAFANPVPIFPYKQANVCEGESCSIYRWTKGIFRSDRNLYLFSVPFGNKVSAVIENGEFFKIVGYDLFTLRSRAMRLTAGDAENCDGRHLKEGDIVYPISYGGEGFFVMWHDGKEFACMTPAGIVPEDFLTQQWAKIQYKGDIGWWGEPSFCRGYNRSENCPVFTKSWFSDWMSGIKALMR